MSKVSTSLFYRGWRHSSLGLYRHKPQQRHLSHFKIIEHTVKAQHTRDRPAGAEKGGDTALKLHVKQYVPTQHQAPKEGDVTIIGAHANGFPKEMYEPFWDELYERLEARGHRVRGVWIADIASQGQSGVINEELLGPDASWFDHGRDLLYLINQFQDEIPHPIIGIGHSVGGPHLAHLSLLHPRLLDALILVDPIFQQDLSLHKTFARLSTSRRDEWPSRKAAEAKFRGNPYYQSWDPRVLEKWMEFGLREKPGSESGSGGGGEEGGAVVLSTRVAQEVYFYLRPRYWDERLLQDEGDLLRGKDVETTADDDFPFHRPEMDELVARLSEIKPSVLYVFGKTSPASEPESRHRKLQRTGSGRGGSGGVNTGRVEEKVLDCGHLVAMEKPAECAEACLDFVDQELSRWKAKERRRDELREKTTRAERVEINQFWREKLGSK